MNFDDEMAEEYLDDSLARLSEVQTDLLALGNAGAEIDEERVNRVLQTVHSVKGGAGFFDLPKVSELAHHTENVLSLIRSRKMAPTPEAVGALLRATDKLHEMMEDPEASNHVDLAGITAELSGLSADPRTSAAGVTNPKKRHLRMLLAEDDFSSRLLLQTFLSRHGECHVAVNGREAVEAVRTGFERRQRYDLICMDIMMPEMDGLEAVRQVRAAEEARGILPASGAKIIMTTAVDDVREVTRCFRELCDGYLVKPIDLAQLLHQMKAYQLIL